MTETASSNVTNDEISEVPQEKDIAVEREGDAPSQALPPEPEENQPEGDQPEGDQPEEGDEPSSRERLAQLEAEGDIAADYLEELLDIADVDGDLDMDVEGDRAAVSIDGADLNALVGEGGLVLESLQELTRLAVYRETGTRSRLMLDIGGYRAGVRTQLVELAEEAVDDVVQSGEPLKLSPMTPFERKVVHDAVAARGLRSESQGVEPTRCVVVLPA